MKRYAFLTSVFISLFCSLQAQNFSREFRKISADEFKMESYSKDPDAEAVVLFDIGKSHFISSSRGFEVIYEKTTRIKIFLESGLKWAEIQIPFYQEGNIYEKIYDLEAISYTFENGRIVTTPLELQNTYNEKVNNSWNIKKFAVPNIKPGSIIEYKYKINSQYVFHQRDWYFQWRIPVIYSEYNIAMIPFYEYSYLLQGTTKDDIEITSTEDRMNEKFFANVKYHDLKYKFVRKDIPAFKSEDFISSVDDYIAKLSFQLSKVNHPHGGVQQVMSTWENLVKELDGNDNFGKFVTKTQKEAGKIINWKELSGKTDAEKFDFIIEYVKNNYVWNNQRGIYTSKSPEKLSAEKNGNAAEINLFTIGLLNAVGIESYPMLVSTRSNGKIKTDYPFLHFFDYVLILSKVNGKNVLSDATETLTQNTRIPEKCINDAGLVIDKRNPMWIKTEPGFSSSTSTNLIINPVNSTEAMVVVSKVLTEYDAVRFKKMYIDRKGDLKGLFERQNIELIDSTLFIKDPLKRNRAQVYSYQSKYKPGFVNGKAYIAPFLSEVVSQNPLKEKERSYPIDFVFKKQEQFECRLMLPEGFTTEFIPENVDINNELFQLKYTAAKSEGIVLITMSYAFKKAVYEPDEYGQVKSFFDELVKKSNERVVLVPTT